MNEQTATQATELDKSRRYLRPVAATPISDDPDGVHLAVYEWMPRVEAWVTGPGLCGESMRQGPLPGGVVVSCARCLEWQSRYERYLDPAYRAEDDDPEVLRRRAEAAERQVAAARKFAGEMRNFCSPHGVATDYADRLVEVMDRAKEGLAAPGVRVVRIVVQAPTDENAAQWAETIRDLVVAEHGQDMRLDVTISPGRQT
jgi:hypothetical protein